MELNTDGWTFIGETTNTHYYMVEPDIMAVVPHLGARDDRTTARENRTFQSNYFRQQGRPGVVIVFADRMASQDKDARRVYQEELDSEYIRAAGMVGMSLMARAIGSFFLGLSKPKVPIKLFRSLDEALAWARSVNRAASARQEAG